MRHPFLSVAGLRDSSVRSERDRIPRRKLPRAQRFSLESLESRYLLSNITGNITPYVQTLSDGIPINPSAITLAGGKLWAGELTKAGVNAIGMVDPASPASVNAYTVGLSGDVGEITTGPDGNAWFTEHGTGKVGFITTTGTTHPIQEYTLASGAAPFGIASNTATSTIWYADTGNNALGSVTVTGSTPVLNPEITIPSGYIMGSTPIVVGANTDGTIWFSEKNSSTGLYAIGSYNPVTNAWGQVNLVTGQVPYAIATGPGGTIWFSEAVSNTNGFGWSSSALGMINPSEGNSLTMHQIATTPSDGAICPNDIVDGPDGNIWYTGINDATIGVFNVTTQSFATENVPQATGETLPPAPYGITIGPDPANSSIQSLWFTDLQGAIDVKLLAAKLIVTTPPSSTITAGAPISVTITAEDASNNVDPTYNGNVTLAAANGTDVTVAAVNGVATFSGSSALTLDTAGSYTLTATASGLTATPGSSVNVVAAAASKLVIAQSPTSSVTAGQIFVVKVEAEDSFNNPVFNYDGSSVSIALLANPGSSTLGGNTPTPFVNGVATFSQLTLNNSGSGYTLQATASGLGSVTTGSFNVTSTATNNAAKLYVWSQPTTPVAVGSPFNLVIIALTSGNGLAASYSGSVTVNLVGGPAGSTVGGLTTKAASGGEIVFSGLTFNQPGTYFIEATASGLTSATTTAITVSAPPPQIQSATVVSTQKTNPKNHRPVGKPVLNGYQFTFNMAMNSATTSSSTSYQVDTYVQVKKKVGKKTEKVLELQPIGFTVNYLPSSNAVQLILTGKQAFKYGGQITLIGTGISSAAGAFLGGNAVYNTSPGGFGISVA